jgi:hypothetical protein
MRWGNWDILGPCARMALGRSRVEQRDWRLFGQCLLLASLFKTVISSANLLLCFISGQEDPSPSRALGRETEGEEKYKEKEKDTSVFSVRPFRQLLFSF